MTFEETIAKSEELDRALAASVKEISMADIGGSRQLGSELGGLFADVRKVVAEAKTGIAAAAAELMTEVRGLKQVETAIRAETQSVREMKTSLLGNAIEGENEGQG